LRRRRRKCSVSEIHFETAFSFPPQAWSLLLLLRLGNPYIRVARVVDIIAIKTFLCLLLKPTGEPVVAAGCSLFSEDDNVRPTVTRGIVTRVSNPVAMLQTTCCVQSGASGGALFRCTGDLLGLICCNIMDTCNGALFPRINMAVPASVLAEPLNDFLRTGGKQ
jgi:S1-C subfamily serine protease